MKDGTDIEAPAGFTLVELMIAMLILAIGIMAVLSIQFTALGGAMNSRDNANGADVARRVLNVMRAESQQWRVGGIGDAGNTINSVYDADTSSWSDSASPVLTAVESAGGQWANASWVSLFDSPVDARLTSEGAARYCAYARGAYLDAEQSIFQVHVAVVFPAGNQSYDPQTGCADNRVFGNAILDPSLDAANSMQIDGFRVQYFGAQILRRGYLAPTGGAGAITGT